MHVCVVCVHGCEHALVHVCESVRLIDGGCHCVLVEPRAVQKPYYLLSPASGYK